MISLQYLVHACHDFFQNECSLLDKPGSGFSRLPESAVSYGLARQIIRYNENIFQNKMTWVQSADDKKLRFQYRMHGAKEEYVDLEVKKISLEDNLSPFIQEKYVADQGEKIRRFALILLEGNEQEQKDWSDKWMKDFATEIKPVYTANYRLKSAPSSEKKYSWMMLWELPVKINEDSMPKNITGALYDAVRYMHYENMVNVLRKVIALRINVEEELIQPETSLFTLYKMSFAKEQGVPLEQVYDPEAMQGLTDSQLATNNLLTDMQKTFGVDFEAEEVNKINTLKDLARIIVAKKTMETF